MIGRMRWNLKAKTTQDHATPNYRCADLRPDLRLFQIFQINLPGSFCMPFSLIFVTKRANGLEKLNYLTFLVYRNKYGSPWLTVVNRD